ncbi:MAG TPA: hypothetical protein ENJ18_15220 [Nannocystis exedens]|nr:hypothetical protein [Nannocystis exedens]
MARELRLALHTRPGETLGEPSFGLPCFADLVHGDRWAIQALKAQLRGLLKLVAPERRGLEVRAVLDRGAAALRLEIIDRSSAEPVRVARATVNALGIASLDG